MKKNPKNFDKLVTNYKKAISSLPSVNLGAEIKIISALKISNELLFLMKNLEVNPYEHLYPVIKNEIQSLLPIKFTKINEYSDDEHELTGGVKATKNLYENIWTIYNNETYDHSMRLCLKRYQANGLDKDYFNGKIVFDGGCGTGRFCIAAALMGAKKVYGMDFGGLSIEFARKKAKEYGVDEVVGFIEGDVTHLDEFEDESIDFVISNGVLHHTSNPIKGLLEHFRVLKIGHDMWLYLYGKNGLLWKMYDVLKAVLKDVGTDSTRTFLLKIDIRQGLIYSFMDNVFAPIRNYYNTTDIIEQLKKVGDFTNKGMRGINYLDDHTLQNKSKYGKELLGEECEVRQIINKK